MIKVVFTDLDGTLLTDNKQISDLDIDTFNKLGEQNIIRVAATGRSLFLSKQVLHPDFPIDYLIFSNGAGVFDWKKRKILHEIHLEKSIVQQVAELLINEKLHFSVQDKIPNNHFFWYHQAESLNEDMALRNKLHQLHCRSLSTIWELSEACQFIVSFRHDEMKFERIKSLLSGINVVRTTSPVHSEFTWMELFPPLVSKSFGIAKLCEILNIKQSETASLGNDFNDLEMLAWTKHSFVVANSVADLLARYSVVKSNNESGFSDFVSSIIDL